MATLQVRSVVQRDGRVKTSIRIPYSTMNKDQSEVAAIGCMQAANCQLEFAKSDIILVPYSRSQKKIVSVGVE